MYTRHIHSCSSPDSLEWEGSALEWRGAVSLRSGPAAPAIRGERYSLREQRGRAGARARLSLAQREQHGIAADVQPRPKSHQRQPCRRQQRRRMGSYDSPDGGGEGAVTGWVGGCAPPATRGATNVSQPSNSPATWQPGRKKILYNIRHRKYTEENIDHPSAIFSRTALSSAPTRAPFTTLNAMAAATTDTLVRDMCRRSG